MGSTYGLTLCGVTYAEPEEYFAAVTLKEKEAISVFRDFVEENADLLGYVSRFGNGQCGYLHEILQEILGQETPAYPQSYRKKKIPGQLRVAVFERDAYRCVYCGDHKSLCADHIHPESKGGEATMDNLQTLCRPCNTKKGAKVDGEWS